MVVFKIGNNGICVLVEDWCVECAFVKCVGGKQKVLVFMSCVVCIRMSCAHSDVTHVYMCDSGLVVSSLSKEVKRRRSVGDFTKTPVATSCCRRRIRLLWTVVSGQLCRVRLGRVNNCRRSVVSWPGRRVRTLGRRSSMVVNVKARGRRHVGRRALRLEPGRQLDHWHRYEDRRSGIIFYWQRSCRRRLQRKKKKPRRRVQATASAAANNIIHNNTAGPVRVLWPFFQNRRTTIWFVGYSIGKLVSGGWKNVFLLCKRSNGENLTPLLAKQSSDMQFLRPWGHARFIAGRAGLANYCTQFLWNVLFKICQQLSRCLNYCREVAFHWPLLDFSNCAMNAGFCFCENLGDSNNNTSKLSLPLFLCVFRCNTCRQNCTFTNGNANKNRLFLFSFDFFSFCSQFNQFISLLKSFKISSSFLSVLNLSCFFSPIIPGLEFTDHD
ncbi:hypothetical protein T4C_5818 [Trichinella pseudospiralis]|uniref:Uncharacterized protein n=1 Tax=Trichinella pseudospiralis TaxID=6337 RepID=A0A0V1JQS7_TRIPS|nr:hypothetical protein T4C_5818 [Trichinella pseudospiralis]